MNIQIIEDKKIRIEMEDQIMETIEDFGEELEGEVTVTEQHDLFYMNDNAELLDDNKKEFFHSVTEKL